ncbi:hypothetical protein Mgra_00000315 [Meloidogyne graminicola]|uniref:V-SNARE coiled-coil homology domain-containing protein n=1 Tax=Meloidogyne graminicola TaxID=189291 RepID=A0A8T0A4L6_9BILA|nr:hypothetical protein Mgra_00000315 [Meloidogyne graminicola]
MEPLHTNQTDNNRKVMSQNMTRILDRGGRLDNLERQSEALSESAHTFTNTGQQLRRTMWLRNLKWTIIFIVFLVILAIMGVFIILHMFKVV